MAGPDASVEGRARHREHWAAEPAGWEAEEHGDRPRSLRAVKTAIARDPEMDIETYLALTSPVLQEVLVLSDLTDAEKQAIFALDTGS